MKLFNRFNLYNPIRKKRVFLTKQDKYEIVRLRFVQGMSVSEITQELPISEKTVYAVCSKFFKNGGNFTD